MYPILFSIGKVNFYSYGLMASLAFFAGVILIVNLSRKSKLYYPELFDHLLLLFICAIVGARISYFITYISQFSHWYEIFYLWNGGMISYGGMAGVIIASYYIFKKNRFKWFDIISVSFLIGMFFWRIGCFLSGDHLQVAYNGFFSISGEFPAILIESILGLIGFILFYFLIYPKIKIKAGLTFFWVLFYYGLIRIFVDNFRIDPTLLELRTGQIVGIGLVVAGLIGIMMLRKKK